MQLQTTNKEAHKATASQWPTQCGHTALKRREQSAGQTHTRTTSTLTVCVLLSSKTHIVTADEGPPLHGASFHINATLAVGVQKHNMTLIRAGSPKCGYEGFSIKNVHVLQH